ncbi:MAG: VRR-NUC domain-containing protein [Porticoccaceae bacterium]|jgi:hypothetical protein|nr:VRR-NUC domain-containing protein [Porticoccaceae bacterium]HLS98304.1 VRR-NUC domain-containing protein [Porticoccaceae bacterium]
MIQPSPPLPAALDNPLYYLANGDAVVAFVGAQHGDLLSAAERARLDHYAALPPPSRALLLRMVMRTHDHFRLSGLHYPELGEPLARSLAPLIDGGWVDPAPALAVDELCRLLRRDELFAAFATEVAGAGLGPRASKAALQALLADRHGESRMAVADWWPACPDPVVGLAEGALFRRVRLMFFGNLRQDFSEFVITALGHQAYEPVALSRDSRAFQSRQEVDLYLALHACREALDAGIDPGTLWRQVPEAEGANPWLAHRRARLLFALGQRAEREGRADIALDAYREAGTAEARVRYFRVRERQPAASRAEGEALWRELSAAQGAAPSDSERQSLARILKRVARRCGEVPPGPPPAPAIPTERLVLPRAPGLSVERQLAAALEEQGSRCFHVENGLFNGLLGLLCWPALYAPLPGAFFHPFQAGPADLYREDFVPRRRALVEDCLASLDRGDYRGRILHHWHSRQGIACPLIPWPLLTGELLMLALDSVPAAHLKAIFARLLADLAAHRSGLPDLIRFWPGARGAPRYELIEVKGPGDRLQDHQRAWLGFLVEQGIPARVCHVDWAPGAEGAV